jgi:uncharacterized protein (DUF2164 family)
MKLERKDRVELVRLVQQRFRDEHDLDPGDLAADEELRFFAGLLGPLFYNQAIEDARRIAGLRAQTIDEELFGLTRERPRER